MSNIYLPQKLEDFNQRSSRVRAQLSLDFLQRGEISKDR
jgi:hypothetical protein